MRRVLAAIGALAAIVVIIGMVGIMSSPASGSIAPHDPASIAKIVAQRNQSEVAHPGNLDVNRSSDAAQPEGLIEHIHWQASLEAAARLKNAARNPDSFKLVHADYMSSGAVCYVYRAQNGFGGMGLGNAVFTPDARLLNDNMSRFHSRWQRYCAHRTGVDKADGINIALKLLAGN